MCGQRWNLDLEKPLAFDSDWEESLRSRIVEQGSLYVRTGIDYYAFPCGLFGKIPPFAVGRRGDDNWFLYQARMKKPRSSTLPKLYQTHDYSHHPEGKEGIFQGTEYQRNIALVGDNRHSFTLDDRTEILTNKGLKPGWDARRLWRFIRAAPTPYPKSPLPARVAFGALNGGINICRQLGLRARVIRSADL